MNIQSVKQRFGIIGNSHALNRAIDIACQVAPTQLTVLINGESGTGKEVFPQIIHQYSSRKHGNFIAVNCGAIPEGTIDSELFGHEKGAFTNAYDARKGYFEVADGGTIFLDEVAELPLSTQVKLLRVLESGEFIKVGSSKVLKTNVRVVAATNVNIPEAINSGKFREDLYYRLNTVPIEIPSLRERKEDILLLFLKFASDFAEEYRMPVLQLDEDAKQLLLNYRWRGNIRQLKNITKQISILEKDRTISADTLIKYLPAQNNRLPILYDKSETEVSDRELLYKVLFDMKKDIFELKKLVRDILQNKEIPVDIKDQHLPVLRELYEDRETIISNKENEDNNYSSEFEIKTHNAPIHEHEIVEESLSLHEKEVDMIKKALEKHRGKRKNAAKELGISERTLYRKIKEYNIK